MMKKSILLPISILAVLILFSCSKENEQPKPKVDNVVNIDTLLSKAGKQFEKIDIQKESYWKSLSNRKSTNASQVTRRETFQPRDSVFTIDYYVFDDKNRLSVDYKYLPSGKFIGAYSYLYDDQNRVQYSVKYNENLAYEGYCAYGHDGDHLSYIAHYYADTKKLTSFCTYSWNGQKLTNINQYYYNEYQGTQFIQTINLFYDSKNNLASMNTSNGINTTYSTDVYNRIYLETINMNGIEFAISYYRGSDDYLLASYFRDGVDYFWEGYYLNPQKTGNYDPTNPLNIFRLNFYYTENNFLGRIFI